jgi:hypothetical protein
MPIFLPDYDRLLSDLRTAALTTDWRSAMAEVLAGADLMPETCRGDFQECEGVAA